jgi:hypothetical protein
MMDHYDPDFDPMPLPDVIYRLDGYAGMLREAALMAVGAVFEVDQWEIIAWGDETRGTDAVILDMTGCLDAPTTTPAAR